LAASVGNATRENVVVPKPGPRRHPGHIADAHTVNDGIQRRIINSSRNSGRVRPVILNGLRIEVLPLVLIIENLGNNNLLRDVLAVLVWSVRSAVCCIALGKTGRIAEAGWVEEGMRLVNAGI